MMLAQSLQPEENPTISDDARQTLVDFPAFRFFQAAEPEVAKTTTNVIDQTQGETSEADQTGAYKTGFFSMAAPASQSAIPDSVEPASPSQPPHPSILPGSLRITSSITLKTYMLQVAVDSFLGDHDALLRGKLTGSEISARMKAYLPQIFKDKLAKTRRNIEIMPESHIENIREIQLRKLQIAIEKCGSSGDRMQEKMFLLTKQDNVRLLGFEDIRDSLKARIDKLERFLLENELQNIGDPLTKFIEALTEEADKIRAGLIRTIQETINNGGRVIDDLFTLNSKESENAIQVLVSLLYQLYREEIYRLKAYQFYLKPQVMPFGWIAMLRPFILKAMEQTPRPEIVATNKKSVNIQPAPPTASISQKPPNTVETYAQQPYLGEDVLAGF